MEFGTPHNSEHLTVAVVIKKNSRHFKSRINTSGLGGTLTPAGAGRVEGIEAGI